MYCCASVRQTIDNPLTPRSAVPYSHGLEVRVDFVVQHRNYNCATQIFVGKCRLHRGGHNIDNRSIPQFPPRDLCVQTRKSRKTFSFEKLSVVYLVVSSFFRTFAKQSIVDSNNITLTAVREKRKTKPRANKHKYVFTLVRMHVRMTSKRRTKRTVDSGTRCKFDTDPSSRCGPIFKIILRMLRKIS